MNLMQKAARWALSKAVGFPSWPGSWTTDNWPAGLKLGVDMESDAGIAISGPVALQCSAIWACVRIRAQMMGHFPLTVYRRNPKGIEVLEGHSLYPILHDSPNALMTSMEWRQALSVNFDLYGNAFVKITTEKDRVVALQPLASARMSILSDNGNLKYEYALKNGSKETYQPDQILHLRNFSLDGIVGLNPIEQERHTVGLAVAQQKFGAAIYKNGGRVAGVLEHPASLSKEAVDRLRETWMKIHGGAENSGQIAILWEGMKYNAIGLSPGDAQYIEARKFQLGEIARIYGVPPHLIADLDRATFSNIEHQGIEFVTYTIAPMCVLWEQRIKKSLLNRPDDRGVYAKFNVAALMRGDASARANFYASMVQNGIMSRDECRELEELTRRGGPADELTVQSNMLDLAALQKLTAGGKKPAGDGQ